MRQSVARRSLIAMTCITIGLSVLARHASAAVVARSVGEVSAAARQIVVGDVVDVASDWDVNHERIQSRVVIAVDDYLFGDGDGTEVLVMSGGTVGDVTLRVSALPVFEIGDHALLFLDDTGVRLVGGFQGAYLTDGVQAVRMAGGCQRMAPDSVTPLHVLLDEIARALAPESVLVEPAPYEGDFVLPSGGLRYGLCGIDWAYKTEPMGENVAINANCADSSAGDAASQIAQLQNGMNAWNDAGADFAFTYGGTSTGTSVTYNSTNLIYFDTTPPDGGSYVAATYIWYSGGDITECDLVFNDRDYTWWNGSGSCSNKMDIWNVATHEFGHFLCLADLYSGGDSAKTMYGYVSNCDTHARTLHADDINGILAIYGAGTTCTPPVANAGPDKARCAGNTVVLQGSATGGSGGLCPGNYSPSWSGPGIVSGGNTFTPTVNANGTYILTVSCGTCQDTDTVAVAPAAPGDWDGDGDMDLADFVPFAECLEGPGSGFPQPDCACGDLDADNDVDVDDFATFQEGFAG